jgi:rSAM/selenodomain-associated transferase 1
LTALIIFIKNPEKGKVKTRLAKDIGDDGALRIYEQLLAHTRSITQDFPAEKFLFYADYPNWNDAWNIGTYHKRIQQGDDLGARMAAAFEAVFEEGHNHAIIIGSDCYELTAEIIGPAHDGGYYLLGMKSLHPALFANIPWSTESVLARTTFILQEMGLSCHLLPTLHDLDTAEDLARSGLQYE